VIWITERFDIRWDNLAALLLKDIICARRDAVKTKTLVLSAVCIIFILLAANLQTSFAGQKGSQVQYQFTSISVVGKETEAYGINQGGDIVGGFVSSSSTYSTFSTDAYHGFISDRGMIETIDVPSSYGSDTVVYGINPRGKAVGGYKGIGGTDHGFLVDGDVFETVDFPDASGLGFYPTIAYGINEQGYIVGKYTDSLGTHGFLKDSSGFTTIDVADSAGDAYPTTIAYGINRQGQIVGSFTDSSGKSHGFLEDNGIFIEINASDTLGETAADTFAYGINPQSQIVGAYMNNTGSHGFLYDNGIFTSINVDFAGATNTCVFGINRHGNIAGSYLDSNGKTRGFLGK